MGGRQVLSCLDGEPLGALDGELASAYFKANPFADPRTGYTNGTRAEPASSSPDDITASSSGSRPEGSSGAKKNTFDWSTVPMLPEDDAQQRCPPELVLYQAHNALAAPSRPKSFVGRLRDNGARGSTQGGGGDGYEDDDDADELVLGVATPRGGSGAAATAAQAATTLGSPERMRELTKKKITSPFDAAGEELGDDEDDNNNVLENENKAKDGKSSSGGWTNVSSHTSSRSSRSSDPTLKLELKGLQAQGSNTSSGGVPAPLTARSGFAQAIKAQLPSRENDDDDDGNGVGSRPGSGGSNGHGGLLSGSSTSVDMSDPYALIRRLIAVVEDLKEEKAAAQAAWSEEGSSNHYYSSSSGDGGSGSGRSGNGGGLGSSWPQRVAALEAEVEELRVQNANVFMLQEENKQLATEAAEARSLKEKCAELEKRNRELAADLEATSAQLQAVHLSQVVASNVPMASGAATPRGSFSSATALNSSNNNIGSTRSGSGGNSSLTLRPPLVGSEVGVLRSSAESLRPGTSGAGSTSREGALRPLFSSTSSSSRPGLPAMPSLSFSAEPNLAPPLSSSSSRPMTARPMTAAEVLDSVDDDMDAEVAALLAANEQSLKELQADVKQCKRDFKGKGSSSGGSSGGGSGTDRSQGVKAAGAADGIYASATTSVATGGDHEMGSPGGSRPSSSRRRGSAKTSASQVVPPPLNIAAVGATNSDATAAPSAPLSSARGAPPSITELLQMRSQGLASSGPSSARAPAASTPSFTSEPNHFSQSATSAQSHPEIWSAADDNTSSDASEEDDDSEEDTSPQTSPQQQQSRRQHTQRDHFARPGALHIDGETPGPRPATSSSRLKNSGPAAAAAAALGPHHHEKNGVNKAAMAAAASKSMAGDGVITVHSPRQAARVLDMLGLNE